MEANVHVLKAIADVHAAEVTAPSSVVGSESSPHVVPDDGCLSIGVFLDAPAAEGLIVRDLVQEISLENCVVCFKSYLFGFVLHVSKVREAIKLEAFVLGEASEGDISLNLVILGQTEGSLRADLAVVLNSEHSVEKTIFLDEGPVFDSLGRVFLRGVLEDVTLLLGDFLLGSSGCVRVSFTFFFDVNVVAIANERSGDTIILVLVLSVDVTELAECEVRAACEVESLGGELILLRVRYSLGHVVVTLGATDTAPEKKLLKVRFLALVQQGLDAQVQAQSI